MYKYQMLLYLEALKLSLPPSLLEAPLVCHFFHFSNSKSTKFNN